MTGLSWRGSPPSDLGITGDSGPRGKHEDETATRQDKNMLATGERRRARATDTRRHSEITAARATSRPRRRASPLDESRDLPCWTIRGGLRSNP